MNRYIVSAVPIIYLLSTLVFQSTWSHFCQAIGIRYDLTPSQFRLMPLGMNLLAASFGLPAVVFLLKNAGLPGAVADSISRLPWYVFCPQSY